MQIDSVFVVITTKDKRILVVKHNQDSYDRDLGQHVWGLPGGGIDNNDLDSPEIAAIREVKEETGLTVTGFKYVFDFIQRKLNKVQPGTYTQTGLRLLWCELDNIEDVVNFASDEICEVKLIDHDELKDMLDVFLLAHLRMILMFLNFVYDRRVVPTSSTPLAKPVECPKLGLLDRELLVPRG